MGQVWVARDTALGRKIALKELRPDQSDNSIICSRFLYEARVTAQLEHPGHCSGLRDGRWKGPLLHHAIRERPNSVRGDPLVSQGAARKEEPPARLG